MKYLFISFLFLVSLGNAFSQTKELGQPEIIRNNSLKTNVFIEQPAIDLAKEIALDEANAFNKVYRFGVEQLVSIDVFEQAEKQLLPNGDALYQLGIFCPNALSINVLFDQFELKNGTRMNLVSYHKNEFIGSYTSLNNNAAKQLGTDIVYDNKVIIEIVVPKNKVNKSILHLSMIVSGYRDLEQIIGKALGQAANCNVDVNCPIGTGWENQRNSVALVIAGGSACSGAMVNNTSGRLIPYYLTANHCGTVLVGSSVYRFRWEREAAYTICANTNSTANNGPTDMTINGSVLRASNSGSDFMLVELNAIPDTAWKVYYNGWDRSDALTVIQATGIHHPNSDIKKISRNTDALTKQTASFNGNPAVEFWRVADWEVGATQPGSSGSPLFDQNKRIVGMLAGGNSGCNANLPNGQYDVYGRFGIAWDQGATPETRLKDWLDSAGINPNFIDGVYPILLSSNKIDGKLKSEIDIFPNPANEFIQINSKNGTLIELVTVADLSGKIVFEKRMNELQSTIHTENLKGLYFVKIQTSKGILVEKILIN
jgi:lysyl endopeptidase